MVVEMVATVEVAFVSAAGGVDEDDPVSMLLLATLVAFKGAAGITVVSGAGAVGACCGAGGGGRFGACLQMDKNGWIW